MGGYQVTPTGPNDDGWEEEGYDESQQAEIIEATKDGPSNGVIMTDIPHGFDDPNDLDEADELAMVDDELGEEDAETPLALDDQEEDELQEDFDDDALDDEDLDDADDAALEP